MAGNLKILMVDDDDELRESLSEQLELHEEFDIDPSEDAEEHHGVNGTTEGFVIVIVVEMLIVAAVIVIWKR